MQNNLTELVFRYHNCQF